MHVGAVERGAVIAARLLEIMEADITVLKGSEDAVQKDVTPPLSPASEAIIREALREDTDLPLFLALGGGLTELASAYLNKPSITDRLTAVWIGGPEYPGRPKAPGMDMPEFNTMIDFIAAAKVFDSPIPLWQVPRDAYRQCLISWAELDQRVRPLGEFGRHLVESAQQFVDDMEEQHGLNLGETFMVGDNPLVLLTALQSTFGPDPSSCESVWEQRPIMSDHGSYIGRNAELPPVRVFTKIDTRLMFADMFAKFERVFRTAS